MEEKTKKEKKRQKKVVEKEMAQELRKKEGIEAQENFAEHRMFVNDNRTIKVFSAKDKELKSGHCVFPSWVNNDNYRKFPYNLLEAFMYMNFSQNQYKLALYFFNMGYGFERPGFTEYEITFGSLSTKFGISKTRVKEAINALERKKVLWKYTNALTNNNETYWGYYFEKHFEFWVCDTFQWKHFLDNERLKQPERLIDVWNGNKNKNLIPKVYKSSDVTDLKRRSVDQQDNKNNKSDYLSSEELNKKKKSWSYVSEHLNTRWKGSH